MTQNIVKLLKPESWWSVEAAAPGQPAGRPPSGEQRGNSGADSAQNSVLPGRHQAQVVTLALALMLTNPDWMVMDPGQILAGCWKII